MTAILPVNIDFVTWVQQLRNSFPDQNIPILTDEKQWRNLPSMLSSNRCFEGSFIPYIDGFMDWRSWASEFLLSIGA